MTFKLNELSTEDMEALIDLATNVIIEQQCIPEFGLFTPYGIADYVTKNDPIVGSNRYSSSSHGGYGIKFGVAHKELSAGALRCADKRYGRYWFEEDCQWMILYYEHPEWFTSNGIGWLSKEECEQQIRQFFPEYFQK